MTEPIITCPHCKTTIRLTESLAAFEARFRGGRLPDNMLETLLYAEKDGLPIAQLLKQAGLTASTTEALRLIEQGGVKLNGEKVRDKTIKLNSGETAVVQVGKRKFAKVTVSDRVLDEI